MFQDNITDLLQHLHDHADNDRRQFIMNTHIKNACTSKRIISSRPPHANLYCPCHLFNMPLAPTTQQLVQPKGCNCATPHVLLNAAGQANQKE